MGVTASNFRDREQLALFGEDDPRRRQTAEALDRIRRKYGERAVTRARLVRAGIPAPFERDPMSSVEARTMPAGDGAAGADKAADVGVRDLDDDPDPADDRDSLGDTDAPEDLDADA